MNPEAVKSLQSVLMNRSPQPLPPEDLNDPSVSELYASLAELREFIAALVQGELA